MFRFEYKVEPEQVQVYRSIIGFPIVLRLFMGVFVDAKILARKIQAFYMYLICSILLAAIALKIIDSAFGLFIDMIFVNMLHGLIDSICNSYKVEQARGVPFG